MEQVNNIDCTNCPSFKGKCCTDLMTIYVREDELYKIPQKYRRDFRPTKAGFYQPRFQNNPTKTCLMLKDGLCSIHHDKPDDCAMHPFMPTNDRIYMDIMCPNTLISSFVNGDPDTVEHLKFVLYILDTYPLYSECNEELYNDSSTQELFFDENLKTATYNVSRLNYSISTPYVRYLTKLYDLEKSSYISSSDPTYNTLEVEERIKGEDRIKIINELAESLNIHKEAFTMIYLKEEYHDKDIHRKIYKYESNGKIFTKYTSWLKEGLFHS